MTLFKHNSIPSCPIFINLYFSEKSSKYLGRNFKRSLHLDLISIYETGCRFDLGEKRCKIALKFDFVQAWLNYILSEFYKLGIFWKLIEISIGRNFKWSLHLDLIWIYEIRCRFNFGQKTSKRQKYIKFWLCTSISRFYLVKFSQPWTFLNNYKNI